MSVVVNNFYYDSKLSSTTMKVLKNFSYRRRSNFDFPHHLQWERAQPHSSLMIQMELLPRKAAAPAFGSERLTVELEMNMGVKVTLLKSWGVPYSPSALLD